MGGPGLRWFGLAVAALLALAACGPSFDLPGTIWTVTAIEGADEMSTGQTIEFPDATSAHLTQPCGEFRSPITLGAGARALTFGPFEEGWGHASCPMQIGMLQATLYDALAAVTGWRAVSADVIELTGGPVVRLERRPDSEMHRIGVEVVGPGAGWPEQQLVLRIGQQSWVIEPGSGGGFAWPYINREVSVEVVRSGDCTVLTTFHPPLDTQWLVRFTSQTDTTLTDLTAGAMELGPPLGETSPAPCPWP